MSYKGHCYITRNLPKSTSSEAHGTTDVHRISEDVEREAIDPMVHQNTKIISKEGAGNAQRPCRGYNKCLADKEESQRYNLVQGFGKNGLTWLVL